MAKQIHAAVLIPGHKIFGQERALLNVAESLRRRGLRVTILLHSEFSRDFLAPAIQERGFPFHFLPMNTIWSPGLLLRHPTDLLRNVLRVRTASRTLKHLIVEEKFDAVVTGNWAFSAYILPALEASDVAFVYRHGDEPVSSNPMVSAITRRVFARADLHVVNCAFLENRLQSFYPVSEVRMIRNSAAGVERSAPPTTSTAPAGRIVYAGQFSEHKGVLILLDAYDIIARAFPKVSLTMAGAHPGVGGGAAPRILARLEKSKADWGDRVSYLGHVDSVPALFTPDAIHVCPSIWDEPSPNVIPEAKARFTPTVAFARGGIPEIVRDGVDGYIVSSETPYALAESLMRMLGSPETFAACKRAAGESLSTLPDEDALAELWGGVVQDAIARHAAGQVGKAS